jgi:heptosyltransferase-1
MRILIIRTSALGDIVHCLPVLTALRRHLPRARIGWVVERSIAPLLAGHPDLDQILEIDLRGWRRRPLRAATWRELVRFLGRLQAFSPDVVLDLMGNHKAGVLAALSLCDRRLGLSRSYRREPSSAIWINQGVPQLGRHAVDRGLSVLQGLELPAEPADFAGHRLLAGEHPEVAQGLASVHRPFALIHAGAAWTNKCYPTRLWGEVAMRFHEQTGWAVVAATGPGEEELGRQIQAASHGAARVVEAPTLPLLVGLLRQAGLVLAGDTGPLHLAHALRRDVLCLMGPTDPEESGPYGAPHRALWRQLPCSFCHQRFGSTKACLLALSPRLVAERAVRMVNAAPPGPATRSRIGVG